MPCRCGLEWVAITQGPLCGAEPPRPQWKDGRGTLARCGREGVAGTEGPFGEPVARGPGGGDHLKILPKKDFMASHEALSAFSS